MSLSLLIIDPDGRAKQWPIRTGTLRLGRGKANDLIIVGRGVSRNHAVLNVEGEIVGIEDQDSTYGTKVNGKRISGNAELQPGDRLSIPGARGFTLMAIDDEGDFLPVGEGEAKPKKRKKKKKSKKR